MNNEDIKILEDYFNRICFDETNKITADLCTIGINEIRAIENLIKGYKEQQEKIDILENEILYKTIPTEKVIKKIEETNKEIKQIEQDDIGVGFTLGKRWSDLKAKVEGWKELLQDKEINRYE